MSPEQKTLIQQTWRQVVPIADTAATLFYRRLFQTDPEIRDLFQDVDLDRQRKRLIEALDRAVGNLDRFEDIVPEIQALGRRHAAYGVRDSHYDSVGAALLWTLAQGLGDAWSAEAQAAWTKAYDAIAGAMQAGAAESPFRIHALGPATAA